MDVLRVVSSQFRNRIDRKNPDDTGLTLEPLTVETKLFQIHDQRHRKLVAVRLKKYF